MAINTVHSFTVSFLRVLQLAKLLDISSEYLNMEEECDARLAAKVIDVRTSIKKLFFFCESRSTAWQKMDDEFNSEQLQDTLLIMDELATVVNVSDLLEFIRSWKTEALAERQKEAGNV